MDLRALQQALLNPAIYPEHPKTVECFETHISLLFFTENYVYKVKKPVDFGFLDFTDLEKRKFYCHQEVELNRRLSSDVYLGVVEISRDGGNISLGGGGRVIEYAVKMRRIPQDMLMSRLIEEEKVTDRMIGRVAEKLADFYRTADTNDEIIGYGQPERIRQDTDENFHQTRPYIGLTISQTTFDAIQQATNAFLRDKRASFERRIGEGKIRDCHGDLRSEHVYLEDQIIIIDCIEFNQRFRYTDVAADIGFLAMDLDYRGRSDFSKHLIDTYIRRSGDRDILTVLDFYKCYRAYVRGKVESFRLDDPHIPPDEKEEAMGRARRFFHLSNDYALNLRGDG
jgi:aminoglycoside phosphotransferase family enzyme